MQLKIFLYPSFTGFEAPVYACPSILDNLLMRSTLRAFAAKWKPDRFATEARRLGHRSRAAFKLLSLNRKHNFLRLGMTVVDLGAAPGGWTEVVAPLIGARGSLSADLRDFVLQNRTGSDGTDSTTNALSTEQHNLIRNIMASQQGPGPTGNLRSQSVLDIAATEADAYLNQVCSSAAFSQTPGAQKEHEVIPGYTADEIDEIFSHGPSRVIAVDVLPMHPVK